MTHPTTSKRAASKPLAIPRLCLDTCSVLDILRTVDRSLKPHEVQAAKDLLTSMRQGRLIGLVAPQVDREFRDNVSGVQEEAEKALRRLRDQTRAANELVGLLRRRKSLDLGHFEDHVVRSRALAEALLDRAQRVAETAEAKGRAADRVIRNIAPAEPGKQSMKDCLVIETYLDAVRDLRNQGVTAPIIFVSRNTTDYCSDKTGLALKAPLNAEFAALNLEFWPNLPAAKHALGI